MNPQQEAMEQATVSEVTEEKPLSEWMAMVVIVVPDADVPIMGMSVNYTWPGKASEDVVVQDFCTSRTGKVYQMPRGVFFALTKAADAVTASKQILQARARTLGDLCAEGHMMFLVSPAEKSPWTIEWWPDSLEKALHACWSCSGKGHFEENHWCSQCCGEGSITLSETYLHEEKCGQCNGTGRYMREGFGPTYDDLPCGPCNAFGTIREYRQRETGTKRCGHCEGRGQWTTRTPCKTCDGSGYVLERWLRQHERKLAHEAAIAAAQDGILRREMVLLQTIARLKKGLIAAAIAILSMSCWLYFSS